MGEDAYARRMFRGVRGRVYGAVLFAAALCAVAVWAALDAHSMNGEVRDFQLVVGAFAVVFVVIAAELLARSLLRPVRELTRVAVALAAGEHSARVRETGDDEIGDLGRTLDRMAARLGARIDAMTAEEVRLRTILDAMMEAVFVTDREGRIVVTNAALTALAGAPVEGRTAVEAIRSSELHDAIARALRGVPSSVEIETQLGTESRILATQVAPLPQGVGVVAVMHDVTDLKLADTVRRDFVANASHELRTPLTAIRGFAETLANGAISDVNAAPRFVGRILEHSVRLQRLVDDLMELSRAEAPDATFVLEPVDVTFAVQKALRGLEASAQAKRIKLSAEHQAGPLRVVADESAIDHVLVNLIDNAIKYTPEDGSVVVRSRREGESVMLEVVDTGPGIPGAHLSRIFERFYRVEPGRSREVGGTGLGLAIVKHLVQRMGGEVSVESRVSAGSTFRVKLRKADA